MLISTSRGTAGIHLGMSGRFVAAKKDSMIEKHTHVVFKTACGHEYRLIDPRRFGRLFHIAGKNIYEHPFLSKLGVEPLALDQNLGRHLFMCARPKKQAIKSFLMDHEVVVGIGNIYASETLWRAAIHPETPAKALTQQQYKIIARHAVSVLNEAIEAGGTTFRDYRDKDGKPGYFQNNLAVYGKVSMPCRRCGSAIAKITQSGRSTFFCPLCQK